MDTLPRAQKELLDEVIRLLRKRRRYDTASIKIAIQDALKKERFEGEKVTWIYNTFPTLIEEILKTERGL